MRCPLCVLGFSKEHSKEDWAQLDNPEVLERLNKILDENPDWTGLITEPDH